MWNVRWWLKNFVVLLLLQTLSQYKICAQKTWDGGGGDSLWNNPLNWQPDGIPAATDTVILNNQWVPYGYNVYFPQGMVSSYAFSLTIEPKKDHQISIVLPSTNSGVPGLTLYSMDTALILNERSTFINASGATAGNAVQLTGKMCIKNGGRYIHQTLRGNALLISNLVASLETSKGIFEFNVPGSSAYTLSASGRTFGTLILNSQIDSRKTYTASGNNQLTIRGDLLINEQATLSSSLINNIVINGNVTIKGRLHLNPISADSIGRCLETIGNNNIIEVSGQFNQGIHFRKWLVSGTYKILNSTVNIDHAVGKIHVQTGTSIDLNNSIIKGIGELVADSNTSFLSSATSIIATDIEANIQTQYLNIHPLTSFTCYGNIIQSTGNRFPPIISKLIVDKIQNDIHLSKPLTISDSLCLLNGKIISNATSSITIMGYCNWGNEKSYFTGRIIHKSKAPKLYFPIGTSKDYTPLCIMRLTEASRNYELMSDSLSPTLFSYSYMHPIKERNNSFCWLLKSHPISEVNEQAQLFAKKDRFSQYDCIVGLDTLINQWKLVSKPTFNDSSLIVALDSSTSKTFTLGKLFPQILPLSTIYLQKKTKNQELYLSWKVDDDENAVYYVIEQSTNGTVFQVLDTINSIKYKGSYSYTKSIKLSHAYYSYYRITGVDIDGRLFKSNIIAEKNKLLLVKPFPNPTNDWLYVKSPEKIKRVSIIHTLGEKISPYYLLHEEEIEVDVHGLKPGNYLLVIEHALGISTFRFMKY